VNYDGKKKEEALIIRVTIMCIKGLEEKKKASRKKKRLSKR